MNKVERTLVPDRPAYTVDVCQQTIATEPELVE